MQKQENFFKKQSERAKIKRGNILSELHKKLKEKSKPQAAERARRMAEAVAAFFLAAALSGGVMPFDTYPLSIALICGVGEHYFAAFAGAVVGGIVSELSREYIFAYISVFAIRLFMSLPFMPKTFLQRSGGYRNRLDFEDGSPSEELSGRGAGIFYRIRTFIYKIFSIEEESGDRREGFFDRVGIRLIISVAGGFICGLLLLIRNDFSYYSLAVLVFMMLVCPVASLLLSGLFDKKRASGGLIRTLSAATAMLLCAYALNDAAIFSISLAPLLAMLFTLIACRTRGVASGLFIAVGTGILFDPRCIPPLVLSCVAYAALFEIKKAAALALVVGICLVWSYYFFDITSFVTIMPPMLVALPIFLIVEKLFGRETEREARTFEENVYFARSVAEESKNMAVKAKVSSLSEAFSSLSSAVSSLSDKFMRPDVIGLRGITDRGFEMTCEGCPNYDVCFGAEYDRTVEAAGRITSALHKKGYVDNSDLGEGICDICVRQKKLVDNMNSLCEERTEGVLRGRTLNFFASSYDDIKDVLQDAIAAGGDEYECDTAMGGKIYEYLEGEGYHADGVVVCGKRCKRVMLKGISISEDSSGKNAAALCKKISEIVGVQMAGPVFEVGDDGMLMLFSAKPRLRAVCASGRRAMFENKDDGSQELTNRVDPFSEAATELREELCGDVTNAFLTDTSFFYSLISDGMGSGAEAATSAGICSMFCEKMLMAGNRADITIRMLNNFLRGENGQRGSECSVTVDLFELDLMLGTASFIKSGAAPTYILRGGEVYKIASKTMPVGIIKNPDIKVTRFDMKKGDLVLMMSDGITGESDECEWVVEMLCESKPPRVAENMEEGERFASALRDKLLDAAREKMRAAERFDDVSLSVVLVI